MRNPSKIYNKFFDLISGHFGFVVSLIVIVILIYLRFQNNIIQQDNYLGYARSFDQKLTNLSFFDSRLYPGFPISIFLLTRITSNYYLSGYILVITSFIGSYTLLNKITKSGSNILFLIFPPIMLDVATIIANEYITVFLILLTVYLIYKKKYSFASFISGLTYWFRASGSLVFPAFLITLLLYSRKNIKLKYVLYFAAPIVLFMIYNNHFFGTFSPFYQLAVYKTVSPFGNEVGFVQVIKDVIRTQKWGQADIFLSGLFYIFFYFYFIVQALMKLKRKPNFNNTLLTSSIIFMSIFIFSFSFVPFLENFARYLVPIIPLFWILTYKRLEKKVYFYSALAISLLVVIK